jgi:hypothetical protein
MKISTIALCLVALSLPLAGAMATTRASAAPVHAGIGAQLEQLGSPRAAAEERPPRLLSADPKTLLPRTPTPSLEEWRSAPALTLTHNGDERCSAKQLREWVMIRCSTWSVSQVDLIAGTKQNVNAWVTEGDWEHELEPAAVVVFPVRPGDRRVFQVTGRSRYTAIPVVIITELWLDDDVPTIRVERA